MTDNKWPSPNGHAIASDKTDKQPEAANVALDLDNAREVFENWLTAGGNYPHLKHKSFGGQYLHEEAAMKWDGFKAGYYALQTPASDGVLDGDVERCVARVIAAVKNNVSTSIRNDVLNDLETIKRALKQSTAKDGV